MCFANKVLSCRYSLGNTTKFSRSRMKRVICQRVVRLPNQTHTNPFFAEGLWSFGLMESWCDFDSQMCSDSFGNGTFLLNRLKRPTRVGLLFQKKRILQSCVNPILGFLSFPQRLPHFFDEGWVLSGKTSRSAKKQRRSFAPALLKPLHPPLLMLSERRSSAGMTLQPNGSSDGSYVKGKGIFCLIYLMYGSNLLPHMPPRWLEPCQVLLGGPDAVFLIVNCKNNNNNKKKPTPKPRCCWTFAGGELLPFSSASVRRTSCGFSSNHVIDSADSLQSSRSVSFIPSSQPLNLTSVLSGRRRQDRVVLW